MLKLELPSRRRPPPNIVNIDVKIVDLGSSCRVHTTPRDGILSLARTYHHLGCMVQMVLMIASLPSGSASTFKYTPIAALLTEYLVQLCTCQETEVIDKTIACLRLGKLE